MNLDRRVVLICLRAARREGLSARTHRLLVAEVFRSLLGYLMLPAAGIVFIGYACLRSPDCLWIALLVAITTVGGARLALFAGYRRGERAAGDGTPSRRPATTARWEALFALLAVAAALPIGIGIYVFSQTGASQDIVCALILTMGSCGSISGRNGSRPKIAFAQVMLIIAPLIASLVVDAPASNAVSCGLLAIFILATYLSIKAFYTSLRTSFDNERSVGILASRLKRTADLFEVALDNMTTGLLFFDKNRRVLIANETVREILGRSLVDGVLGRTAREFHREVFQEFGLSPKEGAALKAEFGRMMEGTGEGRSLVVDRRRNRSLELRMVPVRDQGAVMSVEDVTEKRRRDEEVHHLAHYDNLTGLPNRFTFEEALKQRLAARPASDVAICYLDLDRFKSVNDEFGHHAGDQLLRVVADRINGVKRESDFAARLAGDEFALLLDLSRGRGEAEALVASLLDAIATGIQLNGGIVRVGASAGLVAGGDALVTAEAALQSADTALYEAKQAGGGTARWYDRAMDAKARRARALTSQLELALQSDQLSLVYQPIVDHRTGATVACEALARWTHPEFGPVPPAEFVPIAEQSGLVHRFGRWALGQACRDIARWGGDGVKIAVNLSPLQLQDGSICDDVLDALRVNGTDPARLEIEVTESAIASDPAAMRDALVRLSEIGVGIALDDFGTGYSSLSLLHSLPISRIKLDRSFVMSLESDPSLVRLIASIAQMARTMKKELVVEGVETAEQLLALSGAQVRLVQGFYFCPPRPFDEVRAFAQRSSGRPSPAERARVNG